LEPEIKQTYDQARRILTVSAMASAVLLRRALQHIIRHRLKIEKKRLFDEIEEAISRDELSKSIKDALHHVREIGAWGAHPIRDEAETLIEVEHDEAVYTIEVVEMLFSDLYVQPARHLAMKERISMKRTGESHPSAK